VTRPVAAEKSLSLLFLLSRAAAVFVFLISKNIFGVSVHKISRKNMIKIAVGVYLNGYKLTSKTVVITFLIMHPLPKALS